MKPVLPTAFPISLDDNSILPVPKSKICQSYFTPFFHPPHSICQKTILVISSKTIQNPAFSYLLYYHHGPSHQNLFPGLYQQTFNWFPSAIFEFPSKSVITTTAKESFQICQIISPICSFHSK